MAQAGARQVSQRQAAAPQLCLRHGARARLLIPCWQPRHSVAVWWPLPLLRATSPEREACLDRTNNFPAFGRDSGCCNRCRCPCGACRAGAATGPRGLRLSESHLLRLTHYRAGLALPRPGAGAADTSTRAHARSQSRRARWLGVPAVPEAHGASSGDRAPIRHRESACHSGLRGSPQPQRPRQPLEPVSNLAVARRLGKAVEHVQFGGLDGRLLVTGAVAPSYAVR